MRNTFTVVSRTFSCKFGGLKFVSSCNCFTISLHLNPLAISRNRVSRKLVLIINKQIHVDCPTIFFYGGWFNRNVIQDLLRTDGKFLIFLVSD